MPGERTIYFSSFRLDLQNQQLWRGEDPVALRPKTFAVLRFLVEHAGRLVRRDELVRAIWPNTHGAEKAPKRCILELRQALGDAQGDPRFIGTVGRLGYRFLPPLTTASLSAMGPHASEDVTVPLVGRDRELAQLHRWVDRALLGDRQVVFVTGEPGIGKTSVVETFLDEVGGRNGDLWIARGQCIEQYGQGEAYLPVLEALGRLATQPDSALLLDLLRRSAPSWLAQLPLPLSEDELDAVQRRLQGATQQRMLREIADVISALTARVPLILVLEDLHWSDYSTLDFLSAVTQRREPARLVVIATYRSAETTGDHPLRSVAHELLSHGHARELPLSGLTPTAVDQYLAARFPRRVFAPVLGDLVQRWTGGNPLFLVNLVDDLVAQGLLAQTDGCWTLRAAPETIAARVPENSRRLIEKLMARLPDEIQALLEAASVAGVEFAAEAVVSVLEAHPERIEQRCDELVRQDLFLRRMGAEDWPDGTRTTRYGFRHAVYQRLWSERVPALRLQRFHLRLGDRQEQAYGRRAGEIAAELAVHFDRGGDYQRALQYRLHAARNALQRSAHRDAIDHLSTGLALLAHLPDTPERAQQELGLQLLLGVPLTATMGYAAAEVERAYSRALYLSEQVHEPAPVVQALLGLWVYYFARGDLRTARRLAERCACLTQDLHATHLAVDAHNALGATLLWLGELSPARENLERSLARHDPSHQGAYVSYDTTQPAISCLSHLSWALWYGGFPDQALERSREALAAAQELSHPYSQGYAQNFAAVLHCLRREPQDTRARAEEAIALANDHGFPFWAAMGSVLRSWALIQQGRGEDALAAMQQGLDAFERIGASLGRAAFLTLLAESHAKLGRPDEGLRVLAEALAVARATGERLFESEIYRLQGELTLQQSSRNGRADAGARGSASKAPAARAARQEAEESLLNAMEIAAAQHLKPVELRAAVSLSRLWRQQKRSAEAQALLSRLCASFSEGFETHELQEARRLLRELAQDAS